MVEAHAARCAVRGEHVSWSYRELDDLSSRIAVGLKAAGVRHGDFVPMNMGRSPWFVAGCVGVLKAGAAYVPIDPQYPAERRRAILADLKRDEREVVGLCHEAAGDKAVAVEGAEAARWLAIKAIARDGTASASRDEAGDWFEASPEDAAYVMFTSGSTGKPKGVVVPQRGITRLVCETDYAHFGPEQVWAHMASVSFDAATLEAWGPLLNGGCCGVLEDASPTIDRIAERFEALGVTDAFVTAALFNSIVEYRPDAITRLRQVYTGGEMESVRHFRTVLKAAPGIRLVHAYGPTEVTTFALCHDVRAEDLEGESPRIPIGKPIRGTSMRVLTPDGTPVEQGGAGELFLGGLGVALGYLNQPEATRERFVRLPGEEGVWYRTGDVVAVRDDGVAVFVGRVDRQVKVRGHRIEPEEIEKRLLECPGIAGAVVEVEGEDAESRRLVAYCAAVAGLPASDVPTPARVKQFLGERLPAYMVPGGIVVVPEQRVGLTGKTDRAALVAAGRKQEEVVGAGGTARTTDQAVVVDVLREALRGATPTLATDIFECGAHSLTVLRLVAGVAKRTGKSISPTAIYGARTVERIASLLTQASEGCALALTNEALREGETAPCGPMQASLFYEWRLDPASDRYHVIAAYVVEDSFDPAKFESAFVECVNRHESLRVTFVEHADTVVQRVGRLVIGREVVHRERDLAWSGAGAVPSEARARLCEPFDLARGPVARAHMFRIESSRWLIGLVLHHTVIDEWGLRVVLAELGQPEAQVPVRAGEVRRVAELAANVDRRAEAEAAGRALAESCAAGRYPLLFAPRLPSAVLCEEIDATTVRALDELANRERVTPFAVLFAAYAVGIRAATGIDAPRIMCPFANRERSEVAGDVMCAMDMRIAHCRVGDDETLEDVVRRTGHWLHEEQGAGQMSSADVARALHGAGGHSADVMIQFAVTYRVGTEDGVVLGAAGGHPVVVETSTTLCGLLLIVERNGPAIRCQFVGPSGRPEADIARRVCEATLRVLRRGVGGPPSVGALTAAEPQAPDTFVPADADRDDAVCGERPERDLKTAFRRKAERYADNVAVSGPRGSYTYSQIDALSDRVAAGLQERGIGPGSIVPVFLGRSPEYVAAILAVMKCGAAYCPIDPGYPLARRQVILSSVRARLAIAWEDDTKAGPIPSTAFARLVDSTAALRPINRSPDDCAYVMFTSGSTGKPKGVMVPDRGIIRLVCNADYAEYGPSHRWAMLTATGFDLSTQEIWGSLLNGGACFALEESTPSVERISTFLLQEAITDVVLTATMMNLLVETAISSLRTLRQVFCGGESESMLHMRRVVRECPGVRLVHVYGPTEATTWCHARTVSEADVAADDRVPVGKPIRGSTDLIVRDSGDEVIDEGEGELLVGGPGVALGYLDRAEETAQKFVRLAGREGVWYRTGDAAKRRADGSVVILGRLDRQIKLRGFRIELEEIERVLMTCEGVSLAAVELVGKGTESARLVAWIAASGEVRGESLESRASAWLREHVPHYMVPDTVMARDHLPSLTNGKLDRAALVASIPGPGGVVHAIPTEARRVLTVNQQKVAEAWSEVFAGRRATPDADFFAWGGHSLTVLRLVTALARRTGKSLAPSAIFKARTVERIAALLDDSAIVPQFPLVESFGEPTAELCLVGIPGLMGHPIAYYGLWQELNRILPTPVGCLSFDFTALFEPPHASGSVASAIDAIVAHVDRAAPRSRLCLLGYSMGGELALGAARVLAERGRPVEHVWLLDAFPAWSVWPSATSIAIERVRRACRAPLATAMKMARLARRKSLRVKRVENEGGESRVSPEPRMDDRLARQSSDNHDMLRDAFRSHPLQPYSGPVTLVRSPSTLALGRGPRLGPFNGFERCLTGPRDATTLSIEHLDYLREGAPSVAAAIAERLGPLVSRVP